MRLCHFARNEWGFTENPALAGHEIVDRVTAVRPKVTKFQAGDLAGVGCMVDADLSCPHWPRGQRAVFPDTNPCLWLDRALYRGLTFGGYSKHVVVNEEFALRIPEDLDLPQSRHLFRTWARHLPGETSQEDSIPTV